MEDKHMKGHARGAITGAALIAAMLTFVAAPDRAQAQDAGSLETAREGTGEVSFDVGESLNGGE